MLSSPFSVDVPLEGARGCYAAGTVNQKVQWLNGGANGRVGLAKLLAVMPGDQVSITAYAKYMNLGSTANPNAFITSLAAAFGVSSGSTGEALKIYNGLNSYAATVPGGDHYQDNEGAPKAFVTIIFFDKDYKLLDAAWDQVTTTGAQTSPTVKQPPHDVMSISAKAPEAGYAFVFVSNEHFNYVDVYFDDVTVSHTPSPIVSSADYFPFGLSYNSMERTGSLEQKYLYNGKELQDEMALNWYDYGARMYMPEIGRWGVMDPLADKFRKWSPYVYSYNNPIRFTDPLGLEGEDQVKGDDGLPENVSHGKQADGKWHASTFFYTGNTDTGSSTTVAGGIGPINGTKFSMDLGLNAGSAPGGATQGGIPLPQDLNRRYGPSFRKFVDGDLQKQFPASGFSPSQDYLERIEVYLSGQDWMNLLIDQADEEKGEKKHYLTLTQIRIRMTDAGGLAFDLDKSYIDYYPKGPRIVNINPGFTPGIVFNPGSGPVTVPTSDPRYVITILIEFNFIINP